MNKDLKRLITNTQVSEYCQLDAIAEQCPWKDYEGLTPQAFIEKNFSSIKNEAPVFQDIVAKHCLDLVFIETYSEVLEKKYWFCVYFFGLNEDNEPKYFIGGEPEENAVLTETLSEKSSLSQYPKSLLAFWKIHGVFDMKCYGRVDSLNLEYLLKYLSPEDGEGKVPHYTALTMTGSDIDIQDWVALKDDYVSIDEFENTDFDEDDNFDTTYFVEEYLKKGLYFMPVNGDAILLVESYQDFPQFFYLCHDCSSNFYSSFWEYLTKDISYLQYKGKK